MKNSFQLNARLCDGLSPKPVIAFVAIAVCLTMGGCSSNNSANTVAISPAATSTPVDNPLAPGTVPESMTQSVNDPRVPANVKAMIQQKLNQGH
jgi:hypothetical protein